jgi:hypothetical protein
MSRALYRCIVGLHPRAFRQQFAGEMLWIFDESRGNGVVPLLADGVISLARQWAIRKGAWKIGAAILCAWLHIFLILGSLSTVVTGCR